MPTLRVPEGGSGRASRLDVRGGRLLRVSSYKKDGALLATRKASIREWSRCFINCRARYLNHGRTSIRELECETARATQLTFV